MGVSFILAAGSVWIFNWGAATLLVLGLVSLGWGFFKAWRANASTPASGS